MDESLYSSINVTKKNGGIILNMKYKIQNIMQWKLEKDSNQENYLFK
jgi:hypothetical protein